MKRDHGLQPNPDPSTVGNSSVYGSSTTEKAKMLEEESAQQDCVATLGYKVKSSDMAEVAQKLELLEEAMSNVIETVNYNPFDLPLWFESMLSDLNLPSTFDPVVAAGTTAAAALDDSIFGPAESSTFTTMDLDDIFEEASRSNYDLKAIPAWNDPAVPVGHLKFGDDHAKYYPKQPKSSLIMAESMKETILVRPGLIGTVVPKLDFAGNDQVSDIGFVLDELTFRSSSCGFGCKKMINALKDVSTMIPFAVTKKIKEVAAKQWLEKLERVCYVLDTLLAEIETLKNETALGKIKFFPFGVVDGKGKDIQRKIEEITQDILLLVKEGNLLSRNWLEEKFASLFYEAKVYGREAEMCKIVHFLQSVSEDAIVDGIALVGMGGCGKTTLAKLVYNNPKVQKMFDLRVWVNVSPKFDLCRITKEILEAATAFLVPASKDLEMLQLQSKLLDSLPEKRFSLLIDDVWDRDYRLEMLQLQSRLRESLAGKRTLLVLDDAWDEDNVNWSILKESLTSSARGSKIVVTTRSQYVATAIGCCISHNVNLLNEEDCWSILAMSAFAGRDKSEVAVLEKIGREIAKKSDGLPLAAKAMGILLSSKMTYEEWLHVWRATWEYHNIGILSVLRLSYYLLPEYLRPCILCCSVFPKDHVFNEQELVRYWVAEGLLDSSTHQRIEEVGAEYFDGLVKRSLFVPVAGSNYKIHDLFHDVLMLEKPNFEPISLCLEPKLLSFHFYSQDLVPPIFQVPTSIGYFKYLVHLNLLHSPSFESLPDSVCDLYHLEELILINCHSLILLPRSIVKLINLQGLYVKGTGLLQMPEEIRRLTRLQILTNFIVGNGGSNIKELGPLLDLRRSLSVSELQNVSSALDALDANLQGKRYLRKLKLEWGSNNNDPAKQRAVLGNLEPSKGLEELTIGFYGGNEFPSWLGDTSFENIVFLRLSDCYNCLSLPPLGQLSSLEHLIIERIRRVTRISHEFYRVDTYVSKTFQSLKTLKFKRMLQWEEWISLEGEEFPCLQELYIANCPKLKGSLPKILPSLAKLKIFKCCQLKSMLPRTSETCNIEIYKCGEVQLSSNDDNPMRHGGEVAIQFPPSTSEISVLPHDGPSNSSSSPTPCMALRVSSMKKLLKLPPRLLSLRIERCDALESLPMGILDRPFLECLYIIDCDSLETFPQVHQPSSLKRLYIRNCRNFQFPQPDEMVNHYNFLEHLSLGSSCNSLITFTLNCFPKLKILSLRDCRNLEYLLMENRLQNDLKSLEALEVRDCPKLTTFPKEGLQAPSLTSLILSNCNSLKSMPRQMQGLKSLQTLHINKCPNLEPPPIWSLPTSLNILCISFCDKMTPHRAWQLDKLDSLCHFEIEGGCQEMLSFPENGLLPTNLSSLRISRLLNLKSLDEIGLQHLTWLQTLEINCCDKLCSLPEDGLSSSLSFLSITGCASLNPKLRKRKAKEWFKIAHIPSIHLGEEEDLICKPQHLKAEPEKKSRKILKEVTAIAENEAEKCKSAEKVVGSHTAQEDHLIYESQHLESEQGKSSRQIVKYVTAIAENEAEKTRSAEEVIGSLTAQDSRPKQEKMSTLSQVPGCFRFHPTEEELLDYYLKKKITSGRIDPEVIKDVELCTVEPWDLQELCRIGTEEQSNWYFFSRKYMTGEYMTGTRSRATAAGFWKPTGRDKAIYSKHHMIGMRKTFVFYKGRAPIGQKSDWIMHEYRLLETDEHVTPQKEGWVVCRLFKKKITTMGKVSELESQTSQALHEHFLELPRLESPKLLQAPRAVSCNSMAASNLHELYSNSSNEQAADQATDWRILDKFVASQLSEQTKY